VASCGDEASSPSTIVPTFAQPEPLPDAGVLPKVELIDEAVAAVEAEMGGPQDYFEINASPGLVNLFVSLNNGTVALPYVYLDGQLSSSDPLQGATGNTFRASALDFEPAAVLATVKDEVPGAALSAFVVEGNAAGAVQYSVVINSAGGGQLVAVVSAEGAVLSVDPQ
jgi:hypothetical protein